MLMLRVFMSMNIRRNFVITVTDPCVLDFLQPLAVLAEWARANRSRWGRRRASQTDMPGEVGEIIAVVALRREKAKPPGRLFSPTRGFGLLVQLSVIA